MNDWFENPTHWKVSGSAKHLSGALMFTFLLRRFPKTSSKKNNRLFVTSIQCVGSSNNVWVIKYYADGTWNFRFPNLGITFWKKLSCVRLILRRHFDIHISIWYLFLKICLRHYREFDVKNWETSKGTRLSSTFTKYRLARMLICEHDTCMYENFFMDEIHQNWTWKYLTAISERHHLHSWAKSVVLG